MQIHSRWRGFRADFNWPALSSGYRQNCFELGLLIGKLRRLAAFAAVLGLLFCGSNVLNAQSYLEEQIERHVRPYLQEKIIVGLTVGILKEGESHVWAFGTTGKDSTTVPDGSTVYEIGSITKVFTGILLADAVQRVQVQLDNPIIDLVPSDYPRPHSSLKGIQLRHLSTHSSGLPRMPDNLDVSNLDNPYSTYGARELFDFLHRHELMRNPDDKWEYSNLGVGLLGELLAQNEKKDYQQLLIERIAEPLGMTDTVLDLTDDQRRRLAAPHAENELPATNWDFAALAGAGGIRSTTNDMVRLAEAYLALGVEAEKGSPSGKDAAKDSQGQASKKELVHALELAWEIHREAKKPAEFAMGLGWLVAKDGSTRFHNGQTAGYHSALFINRDLNHAVVVLSNSATREVDRLTEDIFKLVAGQKIQPRTFEKSLEIPPEIMNRYIGKFELAPGVEFSVSATDNKLLVGLTGQPTLQVFPRSETEWYYKEVEASLTFQVDEAGQCNELVLLQNGIRQSAKRIE